MIKTGCSAKNVEGRKCRYNGPLFQDELCLWHSQTPEAVEGRERVRRRAGSRRSKKIRIATADEAPPEPKSLQDCIDWMSWAARATATGIIDSGTSRQITGAIAELRRLIDAYQLERRIKELEQTIARLKKERGR